MPGRFFLVGAFLCGYQSLETLDFRERELLKGREKRFGGWIFDGNRHSFILARWWREARRSQPVPAAHHRQENSETPRIFRCGTFFKSRC